jgi:uncharacterized protein (TIGR03083 family)
VETGTWITAVENNGILLGEAAGGAGLAARVPACPGWRVRDLVRHQCYVHGWAARHLTERPPRVIEEADEVAILGGGPADDELIASYRAGLDALVAALRAADPAAGYPIFLPAPSPLAFWARRQAHETAIHRFDAQAATAAPDPLAAFPADFAADGIDELVIGFATRRRRTGPGKSLLIKALDVNLAWYYLWSSDGLRQATRYAAGDDPPLADCVLEGPASGVYLFLWNRCPAPDAGIAVSGDRAMLDIWNSGVQVTWT